MTRWLDPAERGFLALNRWAVILALTLMSCIVFLNVAMRYFTNNSIIWAEEISRYLMIYMTFLSAGLALRQGLLVSITQFHTWFGAKAGLVIRAVILVVMFVFCLWMIWSGIEYMTRMGRQVTPATRISFQHIYLAMPLGFGLMALHILLAARHFLLLGRFDPEGGEGPSAVSG